MFYIKDYFCLYTAIIFTVSSLTSIFCVCNFLNYYNKDLEMEENSLKKDIKALSETVGYPLKRI